VNNKYSLIMKLEYSQPATNAYFSIQTISEFRTNAAINTPLSVFTIFIIDKASGAMSIDDNKLEINNPATVFVSPGQYIGFAENGTWEGFAVSFNKEFYCIEYHDGDVACNGLLFVNNYKAVYFFLDEQQLYSYLQTVEDMIAEMENKASLHDEMLKNLLKNVLIRSSRIFRSQMQPTEVDEPGLDFVRKFSSLVEKHFKEIKQVEKYADLMGIAPASLAKKLQKYGIDSPSKIIKNRVVTEAKRLLMYTDKSVKEIASVLGYDDPFYFSRLFTKETLISPSEYKKSLSK
jgi:AraC family transcriptional regulator, transcriptional activator of pobA